MTEAEWLEQLAIMQLRWPQSNITHQAGDLWFRDLSEFEAEQVEASITALYRDGREFCPNGAQVRLKLLELRTDQIDHGRAYELAMKAAGPMGGHTGDGLAWLREQSPLAADAVESYGWRDFCLNGTIDEGTRRAQFRDVFKAIAARSERDQRYTGIEAGGLDALPSGPKKIGDVVRALPRGKAA
jgi:hypothetical protein